MTTQQQQPAASDWSQDVPALRELTNSFLFGQIWERPQLSKRDRSMITVAVNAALYRTEQLRSHINRALDNGVTREEIAEVILHLTFYSGWPTGVNAAQVAHEVFNQRGRS